MMRLRPHRRVVLGRNITLVSAAVYALIRAVDYATKGPDALSQTQAVITADGRLLPWWAAAWALTAMLCVADIVNRHTRHGLSLVVGLAFAWGLAYVAMWAVGGFTEVRLLTTAVGWLTPAGLVLGLLIKVSALQDSIRGPEGAG